MNRVVLVVAALAVGCSSSSASSPSGDGPQGAAQADAGTDGGAAPSPALGTLTISRSPITLSPPRDHHTTLVIEVGGRGWLYLFGGTDSWDTIFDDVVRASIGDDGALGPFERVGTLPERRAGHTTLLVDGHVIVTGGLSGSSGASGFELDTTAIAELRPDGTLGTWSVGPRLPAKVMHHTCSALGRAITCVGGRIAGNVTTDLATRTELRDDGTLAPFTPMTATLPESIGFQQAFVHDRRLYIAGGLHRTAPTDDFERKKEILSIALEGDGEVWTAAGELPAARNVGAAEVVGDRVFVAGGADVDDQPSDAVAEGTFAPDGSVSFTTLAAKLSAPRLHIHQNPSYKRWMYFVGGRGADDRSVGTIDVGVFE